MPLAYHTAYVALGSNLDDRLARMEEATARLARLSLTPVLRSPLYDTRPMYLEAQPRFLNGVARIQTTSKPTELLHALLAIETSMGRVRSERNGPRVIDLDLLLWDDAQLALPDLTLPHPRLHERPFVLRPMVDLAPSLNHPLLGTSMADLWAAVEATLQPEERPVRLV